jgi:hypothetical protein
MKVFLCPLPLEAASTSSWAWPVIGEEKGSQVLLCGFPELKTAERYQTVRTSFIERQEPEGGGIDGLADLFYFALARQMSATSTGGTYCDETVILQDDSLAISQTLRDLPALLAVQHHSTEVLVHGVVFVEAQAVLGDHVEFAAEY